MALYLHFIAKDFRGRNEMPYSFTFTISVARPC